MTIAVLLFGMAPPSPARAAGNPLLFSLYGATTNEPRESAGAHYRDHISQVGIQLVDTRNLRVQPALHFGYLELDHEHPGNGATHPLRGQFFGLGIRHQVQLTALSELLVAPSYTYNHTSSADANLSERQHWNTWDLTAKVYVRFRTLQLSAGGYWRTVEGSVSTCCTPGLSGNYSSRGGGALLGVGVVDGQGGTVALQYLTGSQEAIQILFSRAYR